MKKLLFFSVVVFCISTLATSVQAKEYNGNWLVSLYGSGGFTYAGGTVNTGNSWELEIEPGWNIGASVAYAPWWFGAFSVSLEYAYKPLTTVMMFSGDEVRETREMSFLDILFGWKGFASVFYYEFGMFVGIPVGTWNNEVEQTGALAPKGPDGKIPDSSRHTEFGLYVGLGFMFWITDTVSFDIGVQFQGSVVDGYSDPDDDYDFDLKTRLFVGKAGFTMMF